MVVIDNKNGEHKVLELKIISSRVCGQSSIQLKEADDIQFIKDALVVPCSGSTSLEVKNRCFLLKKVFNNWMQMSCLGPV